MRTLSVEQLQQRLNAGERFRMVDVRSPGEFASGHIPRAVNVPMDQLEVGLDDLNHHGPVLLICQSGRRAALTRELLERHPGEVVVLDGGTAAWASAGLPLVRDSISRWSLEQQVRLAAGLITGTGALLALLAHPLWALVPLGTGAGLTFAGLTNICGMGNLLSRMPWNRPRQSGVVRQAAPDSCGR